jgi:hypothetical protein
LLKVDLHVADVLESDRTDALQAASQFRQQLLPDGHLGLVLGQRPVFFHEKGGSLTLGSNFMYQEEV